LLREIVKFRTYIDQLTAAQTLKDKIYADREAHAAAIATASASRAPTRPGTPSAAAGMRPADETTTPSGTEDMPPAGSDEIAASTQAELSTNASMS